VGNLSPTVPLPLQIVVTRELDVVGTCAIAGEYPEALEAIASGDIRVKPLISASVVLEDGVSAFERAKAPGALKVLVVDEATVTENS
jgi:L-iditol 2-dehydrogenase